jgi:hypothetical protein
MLSLHRVGSLAAVALVAAVTAFAASPASAVNPADYPTRDRTQTHNNSAGVIFHPYGDKFEIWDNVKDGGPVYVWYNYVGIDDKWKMVQSEGRHSMKRRNLAENRQIYFWVADAYHPLKNAIVKYRTYGH